MVYDKTAVPSLMARSKSVPKNVVIAKLRSNEIRKLPTMITVGPIIASASAVAGFMISSSPSHCCRMSVV